MHFELRQTYRKLNNVNNLVNLKDETLYDESRLFLSITKNETKIHQLPKVILCKYLKGQTYLLNTLQK